MSKLKVKDCVDQYNDYTSDNEGYITINGQEVFACIICGSCETCKSVIMYNYDYDSIFCPKCNKWLDKFPVCDDPTCQYCTKTRPERPLANEEHHLIKTSNRSKIIRRCKGRK